MPRSMENRADATPQGPAMPALEVEKYQMCSSDQVTRGHKTPVTAVLGIVAIVSHGKVLTLRYHPGAAFYLPMRPQQYLVRDDRTILPRQILAPHLRAIEACFPA